MRRWGVAGWLALCLAAGFAWAQAGDPADLLDDLPLIPDFTVEVTLGAGQDAQGNLLGENTVFPKNIGQVVCRVDGIGLTQPQEVAVVWYREDRERARAALTLNAEHPQQATQLAITEKLEGSWRIEVEDEAGQTLAVVPFVVGKPSVADEQPAKKNTAR